MTESQVPGTETIFSDLPTTTNTFYGRTAEVRRMQDFLDPERPGQKGVALYGMGGSGKTQLALRFILENYKTFSAVLWVNVSTAEQANQCFSEIADNLASKWLSVDRPSTYAGNVSSKKVISRLRSTKHSRWLLVIDSADDLDSRKYGDYIPSCEHGSIIITSTQAQTAEVFRMEPVYVAGLDTSSGSELLLARVFDSVAPATPSSQGT